MLPGLYNSAKRRLVFEAAPMPTRSKPAVSHKPVLDTDSDVCVSSMCQPLFAFLPAANVLFHNTQRVLSRDLCKHPEDQSLRRIISCRSYKNEVRQEETLTGPLTADKQKKLGAVHRLLHFECCPKSILCRLRNLRKLESFNSSFVYSALVMSPRLHTQNIPHASGCVRMPMSVRRALSRLWAW